MKTCLKYLFQGSLWGAILLGMGLGLWPSRSALAATVTIPDYTCVIDYQDVFYKDSLYPLLSYKNVTYFPMTYEYCQALNLSSTWVEGQGLYIAYFPSYGELPIYRTTQNAKYQNASVANYPIYINGRRIDNAAEEYPLLNFRNVTYFPMTWKYAQEEFHWETNWDGTTFTLYSSPQYEDSVSINVYDVGEKSAWVHKWVSKMVPLDDQEESYTFKSNDYYYQFDYATGMLTDSTFHKDGYQDYDSWQDSLYTTRQRDFSIVQNKIVCEGQELDEIKALKEGEATPDEVGGYANCNTYNGIETYQFKIYTNNQVPAPYTPFESYAYVKQGDQFILIEEDAFISQAIPGSDGNLYLNVNFYTHWKGNYNPAQQLYCVQPDGTVIRTIDHYPDYHSMKILGQANGQIYLKCEWFDDYSSATYTYKISPYQDGYFTFDGKNITKIAPYIYTNDDFVTPNGHIYGVINWKDEIRKIY